MSARRVIDTCQMEDGAIRAARGALMIQGQRVTLEDVAVLLLGSRASISGGALSLIAKYGVVVLNCDWRGIPDLVSYGWSQNSKIGARHRAQAELSLPRRKAAWQEIIRAKIWGQENNLRAGGHPEVADRLRELRRRIRSGDSTNAEAQAARIYWHHVFDDPVFRRFASGADQQNPLLDYGYTVLRGFVIRAVAAAGLCPTYGLWHHSRANTFALADDLIEPFRPVIDNEVRLLGPAASLSDREVKKALVEATSLPMRLGGASVASSIVGFASDLASYCESDEGRLRPPVWVAPGGMVAEWPDFERAEAESG